MRENFTKNKVENARGHTDNQMQKKRNYFRLKYGNRKNIKERPNR